MLFSSSTEITHLYDRTHFANEKYFVSDISEVLYRMNDPIN